MGDCDPAWDAGGGLRLSGQHIFGKAFGVCGPTGIGNNLGEIRNHLSCVGAEINIKFDKICRNY